MSFSRDIRHYHGTPRTLQTSRFGPYARLSIDRTRGVKAWVWAIGCGAAVGAGWWILLALWVGA